MPFIDSRKLDQDSLINADLCIVGGGPAGITLAMEFIDQSVNVVLLESGGFELDGDTQALYEGNSTGIRYNLISTRLRMLGGSSNHWAGMGNPLNAMDFEQRDWVPYSGWPISREDLEPYYQRSIPFMGWESMNFSPEYWQAKVDDPRFRALPLKSKAFDSVVFQYKHPTRRFGSDYRANIEGSSNIHVYLHANVTQFELGDNTEQVTGVRVQTLNHNGFAVKAKVFILATGGIENARMLLASNETQKTGLGNDHDKVGRFFMEHTRIDCGPILPTDLEFNETYKYYRAVLIAEQMNLRLRLLVETSTDFQRDNKTLNLHINMRKGFLNGDATATALRSVLNDIDGQQPDWMSAAGSSAKDLLKKAKDLVIDSPPGRRGPEMAHLLIHGEQAPNPDSRITLSDQVDALGMPRTSINWRLTELDRRSFEKTQRAFARVLGQSSLGRQRNDVPADAAEFDQKAALEVEFHHMGTTRMSDTPQQGVVDSQCRVHGVNNLYIAGSSVFPTSGAANPTFTILALTIRLADHLKQVLKTV